MAGGTTSSDNYRLSCQTKDRAEHKEQEQAEESRKQNGSESLLTGDGDKEQPVMRELCSTCSWLQRFELSTSARSSKMFEGLTSPEFDWRLSSVITTKFTAEEIISNQLVQHYAGRQRGR